VAGQARGTTLRGSRDGHRRPSQEAQGQSPAFGLCPWWHTVLLSAANSLKKGIAAPGGWCWTKCQVSAHPLEQSGHLSLTTRLAIPF